MSNLLTNFGTDLDTKVSLFLNEVASYLETEKNIDNSKFKMQNIFYKKAKNRFKNIYINNRKNNFYNCYSKAEMSDDDINELCIATLKSGKNKGQLCNKSVYIGKYCKTHCKNNNDTEIYTDKKSAIEDDIEKEIEKETEDKKEIINTRENKKDEMLDKSKIIIDINKFGNFVFGDTGLVFNESKKIVAKEGPNGEWLTLKPEDIELCTRYRLKYQVIEHQRRMPESTKKITKEYTILSNDWDDD